MMDAKGWGVKENRMYTMYPRDMISCALPNIPKELHGINEYNEMKEETIPPRRYHEPGREALAWQGGAKSRGPARAPVSPRGSWKGELPLNTNLP